MDLAIIFLGSWTSSFVVTYGELEWKRCSTVNVQVQTERHTLLASFWVSAKTGNLRFMLCNVARPAWAHTVDVSYFLSLLKQISVFSRGTVRLHEITKHSKAQFAPQSKNSITNSQHISNILFHWPPWFPSIKLDPQTLRFQLWKHLQVQPHVKQKETKKQVQSFTTYHSVPTYKRPEWVVLTM